MHLCEHCCLWEGLGFVGKHETCLGNEHHRSHTQGVEALKGLLHVRVLLLLGRTRRQAMVRSLSSLTDAVTEEGVEQVPLGHKASERHPRVREVLGREVGVRVLSRAQPPSALGCLVTRSFMSPLGINERIAQDW